VLRPPVMPFPVEFRPLAMPFPVEFRPPVVLRLPVRVLGAAFVRDEPLSLLRIDIPPRSSPPG
jgi:hypothetical protein